MVDGQTMMERVNTIVYVDKNKIYNIIPILFVILAVFLLLDTYFIHTSSYENAAIALILSGILAPITQGIISIIMHKKKGLIIDLFLVTTTFLIVWLGEYVASEVLNLKLVSYLYDPGLLVHTIVTIIASIFVVGVSILPNKQKLFG